MSDIDLPDAPGLIAIACQLVRLDEHTDDACHCVGSGSICERIDGQRAFEQMRDQKTHLRYARMGCETV